MRREYYTQFPQGLVKKMGLHSQPYGVLKFLGTNQNGNLKSYLGNKICVTRNRPSPKYILVYVHSGVRRMPLVGFEVVSKGQAYFLLKNVSTSLGTASTLFHFDNFKMEFFLPYRHTYTYVYIFFNIVSPFEELSVHPKTISITNYDFRNLTSTFQFLKVSYEIVSDISVISRA